MTLTIGNFTYGGQAYTAQPFGYDEADVKQGLTARKVQISALMTETEWQDLLSEYDTWRDVRITEPDSKKANDVGTTVEVSLSANGVDWVDEECWFLQAPAGEQAGTYVQVTVALVVAAEALEVAQRQDELSTEKYYFGTYELGDTTVNLLRPPETYQDTPQLSLTASGVSYIQGPLSATRVVQIEGDTDSTGWDAIQTWYEDAIQELPAAEDWFPLTAPSATAEAKVVGGIRTDVYTVSISLGQVR